MHTAVVCCWMCLTESVIFQVLHFQLPHTADGKVWEELWVLIVCIPQADWASPDHRDDPFGKMGCPGVKSKGMGLGGSGPPRTIPHKIFEVGVCTNLILGIFQCLCECFKLEVCNTWLSLNLYRSPPWIILQKFPVNCFTDTRVTGVTAKST